MKLSDRLKFFPQEVQENVIKLLEKRKELLKLDSHSSIACLFIFRSTPQRDEYWRKIIKEMDNMDFSLYKEPYFEIF